MRSFTVKIWRIVFAFALPAAAVTAYLLRDAVSAAAVFLPKCAFKAVLGLDCPGCGITRSVISAVHLDIIGSIRYNPAPAAFAAVLILLYIENIFHLSGKNIRILPRNKKFWIPVLCLFGLFYIFRMFIPRMTV